MLRHVWLPVFLLCAPAAPGQLAPPPVVSLTGVVQPASSGAPTVPCAPPTHTLECLEDAVSLRSATLDLDAYVGQNVKLIAQGVDETCPLLEVLAVEPPETTLAWCGTPGLGCEARLRSGPGGLSQHALLVSLGPGLVPSSPAKGSLLLAEPFFVLATSDAGHVPPEGAAFDFVIPVDFALVGVRLYFQAVRRDVGPVGPIRFSNATCLEILGLPIQCETPAC